MDDEQQNRGGEGPAWPRLPEEQRRERVRDQVMHIVDSLGGPDAVWFAGEDGRDDPADFDYLYGRGRILVRDQDVERVQRALDGGEAEQGLVDGVTSFRLPGGLDCPEALEVLDDRVGVGVGTPDTVLHITPRVGGCCPATEPDVPAQATGPAPAVGRAESALGAGVFVSVVDTGWYGDATGWASWLHDVTGDPETVDPQNIHRYAGHGTFIAGVVRALAPQAEVRVEGFLPHGGAVLESNMVVQLVQALQNGPDVISLSAGATTRKDRPLLSFEVFWERHLSRLKGTVLVAAAGNDGTRVPFWPAAFPWTLSVGALDTEERRADFSNHGSWVDVYALGVDHVNAFPKGTFTCQEPPNTGEVRTFEGMATWSGTSFSTPLVAALIAARMSTTGLSARHAADWLLARARKQAVPGVGPVLRPGDHA